MRSAQNAFAAAVVSALVAIAALEYGLVTHDFSLSVVAEHTSRKLPLIYTITSLWASQEGSLLLWLLVLTGAATIALRQNLHRNRELMPWVAAVMGAITVFFAGMATFVSSPFAHVAGAVPRDGTGLDPSLQNVYMAAHPPMLYLGYVSMSVPFAFAMASLITGRADARWLVSVRRWTLVSWTGLGIGMLLGAHWAYVEIGWGGYWAWDPVESAALMPWLAATAFLHSIMVQEKKGMLKVWNMVLVIAAFALCLFGDFLTRSGVVQSVHSFVQSAVGPYLLAFLAAVLAFSVGLLIVRLPTLRADHKLESVISREATFLFNNLLLLALAFAILWGVVFPILSEAVRGVRATVAAPYYDFFLVVFGLPLLALTGIGPLIAWRRASPGSLWRMFRWPVISALAGAVLLWLAGFGSSPAGPDGALAVRVRDGHDHDRVRPRDLRPAGACGRHVATGAARSGQPQPAPLRRVRRPPLDRAAGGRRDRVECLLDRAGGASCARTSRCASTATRCETTASSSARGRTTRSTSSVSPSSATGAPTAFSTPVSVSTTPAQVGNEVDIRTSYATATDLYSILQGVDSNGSGGVSVKVLVNPAVGLVWLAGIVFALGALITIWPDPREARQLARRYGELLARSEA